MFLFALLTYLFSQYCSFMMIIREEVEREWQISLFYRVGTKDWPPYSIKISTFFEFCQTLWHIIISKKHILVKTRLQKVDFSKVYTQKVQEKFKKRSCSKTIGGGILLYTPCMYTRWQNVSKPKVQTAQNQSQYVAKDFE